MKKLSPNASCPCGSGAKYKKCCQRYHKGAIPQDALTLMKSRYSAYAVGQSSYIMETTHPDNPDYSEARARWKEEIEAFSRHAVFLGLEILTVSEGEVESFVTFRATLDSGVMVEKSRFFKVEGRWLYVDGEMESDG